MSSIEISAQEIRQIANQLYQQEQAMAPYLKIFKQK